MPKHKSLEVIIEETRCKGCMGYPETKLKEVCDAIRSHLKDLIERCLVENDSDTHIIAKDLLEKI